MLLHLTRRQILIIPSIHLPLFLVRLYLSYQFFGILSLQYLFIVIEFSDPSYREFDPVSLKGLAQHKEEDFIIKPIAFRSERSLVNKKSEPFQTIYVMGKAKLSMSIT